MYRSTATAYHSQNIQIASKIIILYFRIVCANKQTISASSLPTDDTDYVDEKVILMKIEAFRLIKVVISGLELGQYL